MLYQNLMMGSKPFLLAKGRMRPFGVHRHPEIEMSYCVSGTYDICIDNRRYTLHPGDLAIVGCMIPHEIPEHGSECLGMTLEVGPVFLRQYFRYLADAGFAPVYTLPPDSEMRRLLDETEKLIFSDRDEFSELERMGNIYRICAQLMRELLPQPQTASAQQQHSSLPEIEKALELIYNHYAENITVDDAAAVTGYAKSYFCRIFKSIVGASFHHVLNNHRVENACFLLRETSTSLSEIAAAVGFADTKSFCRVFKSFTGTSPGAYRKQ